MFAGLGNHDRTNEVPLIGKLLCLCCVCLIGKIIVFLHFLLGHIVVTAGVEKSIGWKKAVANGGERVFKLNDGIFF